MTLYAAIPIRYGRKVVGAVLVSQSTLGILQALYAVRLDIFKVVLAAVAVAAVLSLLVSTTIARPLQPPARRGAGAWSTVAAACRAAFAARRGATRSAT